MAQSAPAQIVQSIRSELDKLEEANHYERLDVSTDASSADIRKAYMEKASKWHPDRFSKYDLGEAESDLQRLFALLTEAHSTLTSKEKRSEYDASLELGTDDAASSMEALLGADKHFRLGQELLERGQIAGARKQFNRACELNPNSNRFQAYRAWTEYAAIPRDDKGTPREEDKIHALKRIIQSAVEELDNFDMGYYFLGQIFQDIGEQGKARNHYKKAVKINPKNVQAQRQLRLQAMRSKGSGKSGGGFFEKLKAILNKKL